MRSVSPSATNVVQLRASQEERLIAATDLLYRGKGSSALYEIQRVIDEKYFIAHVIAGQLFERGAGDVAQDFGKAKYHYTEAVDRANAVHGLLGLGRLHFFGRGVRQDHVMAIEYYRLAERVSDHPLIRLMLGRLFLADKGIQVDRARAREYFWYAANRGYVYGWTYLALLERQEGRWLPALHLALKA